MDYSINLIELSNYVIKYMLDDLQHKEYVEGCPLFMRTHVWSASETGWSQIAARKTLRNKIINRNE